MNKFRELAYIKWMYIICKPEKISIRFRFERNSIAPAERLRFSAVFNGTTAVSPLIYMVEG